MAKLVHHGLWPAAIRARPSGTSDRTSEQARRMTSATQARPSSEASPPPFQLRGGAFTLLVLRLNDPRSNPNVAIVISRGG